MAVKQISDYEIKDMEYEAKHKPPEMLPPKEYDDVTKYNWGIKEDEAIKRYVVKERLKMQANLDFVEKQKKELDEMVKAKSHVVLFRNQINAKFPNDAEEKQREAWVYKQKNDDYKKNLEGVHYWKDKADKIDSGEWIKHNSNSIREKYQKEVKDAIKHGKPVPIEVIKQYPEFTKSADARERYEKGKHTSFANDSIAVDIKHKGTHGIKIKLQDGSAMTEKYAEDIIKTVDQYEAVFKDIKPILASENVTIAHTKGKHPFLSTAAGVYHPSDITVTMGMNGVGAHELTHMLDETAKKLNKDKPLYDYNLLALAKKNLNGGLYAIERALKISKYKTEEEQKKARELRYKLGAYWQRPEEVNARLVEQYIAYKDKNTPHTETKLLHDSYSDYTTLPGYWDDEIFQTFIPAIEVEMKRKIELANSVVSVDIIQNFKKEITVGNTVEIPESKVTEYQNPAYTEAALKSDGLAKLKAEVARGATVAVPEEVISDAEDQRRVDEANKIIKIKHDMDVGVFLNGVLLKGGFKSAYEAHNFMNDHFFVGSRSSPEKHRALNPMNFGYTVELIEDVRSIINEKEVKAILKGETITVPEKDMLKITAHMGTEVDREQIANMQKAGRERNIPIEPMEPIPDILKGRLFLTALSKMTLQELQDAASRVTHWGKKLPSMKEELETAYKNYRDLAKGKTVVIPEAQVKAQAKPNTFMKRTWDKEERGKQKEIFRAMYTDYDPKHHDNYVDRYNKEIDANRLATFYKNREGVSDKNYEKGSRFEYPITKSKTIPAPKYNIGDMVYSYRNPTIPFPIQRISESNEAGYDHNYVVRVRKTGFEVKKDGESSFDFWILEPSLSKTPIKPESVWSSPSTKKLSHITVNTSSKDYKDGYSLGIQGKIAPAVPSWSDQGQADFAQGYKDGQQIALTKGKTVTVAMKSVYNIPKPLSKEVMLKGKPYPIFPKAPLLLTAPAVPTSPAYVKKIQQNKTVEVPESAMAELEAKYKQKGDSDTPPYFRVNDLSDLATGKTIVVPEKNMKPAKKPTAKAKAAKKATEKAKCPCEGRCVPVESYDRACPKKKK